MSARLLTFAFGLGVFVLVVAFIFPTMMAAPGEQNTQSLTLDEGENQDISGVLSVTAVEVGNNEVEIEVADLYSGDLEQKTIDDGGSETFIMDDNEVTVTAVVLTNNTVRLITQYDNTHGWDEGLIEVATSMDLFLALIALMILVGMIGAIMGVKP